MDAAAPDLFRIRDHVADFESFPLAYAARSEATRGRVENRLDIAYGDGPAEHLDIFLPASRSGPVPVHVFVHGGYWRMFSKSDFSFVADTVVAAGAIAIIIDYALMPAVRMATVVAQVRKALDWVVRHAADFGGDPGRISISGHSAGAHLCCFLIDESRAPTVKAALLLGGLYDLAPLQQSFLANEIALTDDEVRRWTPLTTSFRPGPAVTILVGDAETRPFHDQADAFGRHLTEQGLAVGKADLMASNHMSSVGDLGHPASAAGAFLTRTILGAAAG